LIDQGTTVAVDRRGLHSAPKQRFGPTLPSFALSNYVLRHPNGEDSSGHKSRNKMEPVSGSKREKPELEKILVFRVGHLGDTLVALPAFSRLRQTYPAARLSLLTNENARNRNHVVAESVLPGRGLFDDYFRYPGDLNKSPVAFAKLLYQIRKAGFDAVFYLMNRNRTPGYVKRDLYFFWLAGIRNVLGARHLMENWLDPDTPKPVPRVNSEAQFLLECLEREGIGTPESGEAPVPAIFDDNDAAASASWLEEKCGAAHAERRLIAIAPGSKWESKIWDEEKYEQVVGELVTRVDAFPVIFGGPEEIAIGERLLKRWKRGANAAGSLNVKQAAAALRSCRLYLGNDTGTMHLAASSGTKCVAIFSSLDWEGRWYPIGDGHRVFRETVPCSGCLSPVCHNDRLCLNLISSDDVLKACFEVWDEEGI
jgi:ADP-heptose:LPS heptosyltransferase